MVSDRVKRSFAQAYRWIVAGVAGTTVNMLIEVELPALHPFTWILVTVVFLFLLGFIFLIEYWIQGALDPEYL